MKIISQPDQQRGHTQLATLLLTPWRATQGSARWTVLVVMLIGLAGSISVRLLGDSPHTWLIATILYGFGIGFLFLMFSSVLPLAMDARRLRMPGIQHAAVRSLLLYAALAIIVPVVMLSPNPTLALTVALLVALVIAGVLAFVLLPRYLSIPMIFIPSVGLKLWREAHLPLPGHPGFVGIGMATLVVLVLANVLCWRRLLSGRWQHGIGWSNPSVMMFHRRSMSGDWTGMSQQTDSRLIRQRPDWLQVRADLRNAGPAAPVRALRIALGGWYLPQTWASHVRQFLPAIAMLLVYVLITVLPDPDNGMLMFWRNLGLKGLVGMVMLVTAILVALMPFTLQHRWQQMNAELPLLALLPGLGDAASRRRFLLHAALGKPLCAAAMCLVAVLGMGTAMHADVSILLWLAMPILACAGIAMTTVLAVFGDRLLRGWMTLALFCAALSLLCFGTILPLATIGQPVMPFAAGTFNVLGGCWLAMGSLLCWFGLRGWRGLQQRPHPFLANER